MISIVIPSYNRGYVIGKSIESVLRQTYSDFELLIVDDGSSDNTRDVVSNFKDERIRYVRVDENKGANHARNIGVDLARGDYVAFQDSDDVWRVDKLQKQMEYISSNDVDAVFCLINQKNNEFSRIYPIIKNDESLKEHVLVENLISTQTLLAKRSVLLQEKFDERLPRFQDWDLAIRLIYKYRVGFINESLVNVFIMNDSISKSPYKAVTALKIMEEKYIQYYRDYNKLSYLYKNIFTQSMMAERYDIANCYINLLVKREKNIKNYVFLFLSKMKLLFLYNIYREKRVLYM